MGVRIRDGAGNARSVTGIKVRDAGGVLRTVQMARVRDGSGTLRTVFTAMSAAPSAPNVYGTAGSFGPGGVFVQSSPVTVTVSGGVAPFTYAWTRDSGSATINATLPAAATTRFSATVPYDSEVSANFVCTVTDANGATATASVLATLTHVGLN